MALFRNLFCLAFLAAALTAGVGARAGEGGFSGGTFTCLQYVNGLGDNSAGRVQSAIAHLWIQGYLSGYYKGKGTLEFTDDPAEPQALGDEMVRRCQTLPQNSILAVTLQTVASQPRKMPKLAHAEFSPSTYTCGQHLEAKGGPAAKANAADLAEMWAFAFIQGYKNVALPDMEIKPEFRDVLINAVNKVCANNKDKFYADYAALVADRVKIEN
jgi:hypothetical protein